MIQVLGRLAMAVILWTLANTAQAATIRASDGQGMGCFARIDGPIGLWDARAFTALLAELPEPDPASPVGRRVCLDSIGGTLAEAVRMADEITRRSLGTAVPAGATCESACAVLFLAGRFSHIAGETAVLPDRILHPRGRLGFHSPALVTEDRPYAREEVNTAHSLALSTLGEVLRMRSETGTRIADSLLLTMLNTPANDMTYVETVEQAAQWQIEVAPVALTAVDIESALRYACLNADGGMLDQRPSDTYLYGSANLPFSYANPGPDRAQAVSIGGFRAEASADCQLTLAATGDPLGPIGYVTIEGGFANQDTRSEVYAYQFHDPRLPLEALPVADSPAAIGEKPFFAAIQAAARRELSEVEIRSCWLLSPEARIVNVNEYVNLRDGAGFGSSVVRQVPLGERVRVIATQDLQTPEGGDKARACLNACNELALDPADEGLRAEVIDCIEEHVFWYEIRDASGQAGFISRQFLEE